MGYRSDVCIALTDDATRLLKTVMSHLPEWHEALALAREDGGDFIDITAANMADADFDCSSKLYFDHVKWYEDYEDVSFFENMLQNIDEEEWLLTRVGEETNDIEQTGAYWDSDVYVSRKIEW